VGVIRRFPLTCFLSLYHPHPGPPPLGAGVIGADRVVSELEARAPRGNIPLVKALRIVQVMSEPEARAPGVDHRLRTVCIAQGQGQGDAFAVFRWVRRNTPTPARLYWTMHSPHITLR
jgi:hypothetical protein